MSNVQTSAERSAHDMSHFVYSSGGIGCLKVLSFENLNAGDSLEMNMVGSFRLSPLKRGLALDTCVEIFTFYVPYRHAYDHVDPNGSSGQFVDFMKKGMDSTPLPSVSYDLATSEFNVRFLGTRYREAADGIGHVPQWLSDGYARIFNNYFKLPWGPDMPATIESMTPTQRKWGMECNHLKTMWSAPINPNFQGSSDVGVDTGTNTVDIMDINKTYGKLHTQQQRELFMSRYRDVIESFGGHTTIDADSRPRLLMRTKQWASGYDVDGTSSDSLGQFSGRVQQTLNHRVPRWFCPEHGAVITLALVRFPPVVNGEMSYLVANPEHLYSDLIGDPSVVGNDVPKTVNLDNIIPGAPIKQFRVPAQQWQRYHHSHVDEAYDDIGDFPFIEPVNLDTTGVGDYGFTRCNPDGYDKCFQTLSLGHWNIQAKFNDTIYRELPSARDALMTS